MRKAAMWIGLAASLWGQVTQGQVTQVKPFVPKSPPEQPIPFSHKTHTEAAKLKCLDCHTIRPPGDAAGLPAENVCMGCHTSIKKDSPPIQKLAGFAAQKKPAPWVRIYRLPRQVYFPHEVHANKAKV